jgi:hypothetical protein
LRQSGKPCQRRRMSALDIDQHIRIDKFHRLGSRPPLRFIPESAGMGGAIGDVWTRANQSFPSPIGKQFRARAGWGT